MCLLEAQNMLRRLFSIKGKSVIVAAVNELLDHSQKISKIVFEKGLILPLCFSYSNNA